MSDESMLRSVHPAMASMLYDAESMMDFKKRVDKLITNLNDSPAAPDKVSQEPVGRSHFGGDGGAWAEANGLSAAYTSVIDQLKDLSQLLADSLEGMGIAVVSSKHGYEGEDDDIRARMLQIQKNMKKHYNPELDPTAQQNKSQGQGPGSGSGKDQSTEQPGDTAGVVAQ
ncbi:hypothetical protein ACIQ7D_08840 [Streptomyces sp. NPDC096310]|uniref:hypothetical protein n=1 Tax=Streptomyces sp. NPDC096310 TaxID=3366082 RepID=UPI0037FB69BA